MSVFFESSNREEHTIKPGKGIIRIDPAFVIKDQVMSWMSREVNDKYIDGTSRSVHGVSTISAEPAESAAIEEELTIEVEAQLAQPLETETSERRTATAVVNQRLTMDAEQPVIISLDSVGYEVKPLAKCIAPATIEEMRPAGFLPLDGKPTPIPVPTGTADLTEAWCTKAFRHRGLLSETESITKVTLKPLGAGEGEFSELALMTLECDGPAPKLNRNLVAKFSPPDMSALELKQVFGTEAHFYNDTTVEAGGMVRPEAPYVGFFKGKRCQPSRYCIIMESAAGTKEQPTLGFKRVDGCASAAHMRLVMRGLARFHARWWGTGQTGVLEPYSHPDCAGGPLPKFPKCIAHTAAVLMFKNGIKALPRCFSNHPKYEGVVKFAQEYAPFIKAIRPHMRTRRHAVVRELFRHPLTLVHGDAHLENVFFGEQYPGGCTFIDFGLLMLGAPLGDVSTIIAGGMPVDARRTHEEALVKEYYAALTTEFGVDATTYTWEQCWRDYKYQLVKPFFQLLIMAPGLARQRDRKVGMFATEPSAGSVKLLEMYAQLSSRIATALMDHKWYERVLEMKKTAGVCRPCW